MSKFGSLDKSSSKLSSFASTMQGSRIAKLQDTGNLYASKIRAEQEKLRRLDEDILVNQNLLEQKRQELITTKRQFNKHDPEMLKRQGQQYQHRLDMLKIKHNEMLDFNKQLRTQIDGYRSEKNIFDKIYYHLKAELDYKTENLDLIIQESQQAQQQIQLAKVDLQEAKVKALKEQKDFEEEYKSIYKVLDMENRDEKLKEIRDSKFQKSIKIEKYSKLNTDIYITQNINESPKTQKKNNREFQLQKDLSNLDNIKQEVQQYEQIFKQLQVDTGKSEINDMVKTFVDYEEQNYSLYNYINTLSDELEELDKKKKNLEDEIKKLQAPQDSIKDPRIIKIKKIKAQVVECKLKQSQYEDKQSELNKIINSLKMAIPIIFQRIGCSSDSDPIQEQDINDINEGNILYFLGIIEKQINDILRQYSDVMNLPENNKESHMELHQQDHNDLEGKNQNESEFKNLLDKLQNDNGSQLNQIFNQNKQSTNKYLETASIQEEKEKKFINPNELREIAEKEYKRIADQKLKKNKK